VGRYRPVARGVERGWHTHCAGSYHIIHKNSFSRGHAISWERIAPIIKYERVSTLACTPSGRSRSLCYVRASSPIYLTTGVPLIVETYRLPPWQKQPAPVHSMQQAPGRPG
jgi:hypothetical protein